MYGVNYSLKTLNAIYNALFLYTYVHAYVNYQRPFHSSLTHKQLPHTSADIKQSFSPTLMVIKYKFLKNIRHNLVSFLYGVQCNII